MVVQTLGQVGRTLDRPVAVMLVPDFSRFSFADYVAYGFNVFCRPGPEILSVPHARFCCSSVHGGILLLENAPRSPNETPELYLSARNFYLVLIGVLLGLL